MLTATLVTYAKVQQAYTNTTPLKDHCGKYFNTSGPSTNITETKFAEMMEKVTGTCSKSCGKGKCQQLVVETVTNYATMRLKFNGPHNNEGTRFSTIILVISRWQ